MKAQDDMHRPLLESVKLGKIHRVGTVAVEALRDVTVAVNAGEFVSVVGPSGSGKSTLLNIWGMLDIPTSGQYCFDGIDVGELDSDARASIRSEKIGFVFQNYNLLARNTAVENVELPLTYAGIAPAERRERALQALESMGLAHRHDHWPHQLSGGEQQRVAIARALVNDPRLILADEPTGAIDRQNGLEVMWRLQALNADGRTIVLVTHDAAIARHASRVVALEDGSVRTDARVSKPERAMRPTRLAEDTAATGARP